MGNPAGQTITLGGAAIGLVINLGDNVANKAKGIKLGYKVALVKTAARELAEVNDHIKTFPRRVPGLIYCNVGLDIESLPKEIALYRDICDQLKVGR
jgi:hypothetical protein